MQSYRIDFAMNHGHEMTLDRESGIARNELDEIELNMLHSQRIPYLLPIDWFELDGKVTFRYILAGLKMLLHRLQQQSLTMEQYYMLILGVTDALIECRHYMLRPEGCLLDEQFIFIGEQLHDIRLVYVPMKDRGGEQAIGTRDLLALIVRFTSYIEQIDGDGLKRILHHLSGKKWPLEELRSTLLELIGGSSLKLRNSAELQPQSRQSEEYINQAKQESYEPQHRTQQPFEPKHLQPQSDVLQSAEAAPFRPPAASKNTFDDIPYIEEQEDAEQNLKKKWIFTAGLIIGIASVWRFIYFTALTRQSLFLSAGISLILLAVVLYIWRKSATLLASTMEAQFEMGQFVPDSGPFGKLDKRYAGHKMDDVSQVNSWEEVNGESPAAPLHVVAANSPFTLVEPTVLLGHHSQSESPGKPLIWLERSWEGQDMKVELTEELFKIGRTDEQVSYVEHANGVSRIHLEIECVEGEYKAKDLGSRNGSLLNGQAMIPYKLYKLSVGDVIHLAGEKGPSYELKSG